MVDASEGSVRLGVRRANSAVALVGDARAIPIVPPVDRPGGRRKLSGPYRSFLVGGLPLGVALLFLKAAPSADPPPSAATYSD